MQFKYMNMKFMLHSRAIGIIINTSFLVGNWPYKASPRPFISNLTTRKLVFTIIPIARECSISTVAERAQHAATSENTCKLKYLYVNTTLHCKRYIASHHSPQIQITM